MSEREGTGRSMGAAVARKPCVAIWHVMEGHVIGALERLDTLHTKLHKLATELGLPAVKALRYETVRFVHRVRFRPRF